MTTNEIQEILKTKKRGQYFHVVFKKEINGYVRTTTTIVRLVNYSNTKKAKERRANNPTPTIKKNTNTIYLGDNLIYNTNTNKTCLQVFLTKCKYHHPKSVYEYQGQTITFEEFYEGTHTKPSNPSELLNIDITNIVAIY